MSKKKTVFMDRSRIFSMCVLANFGHSLVYFELHLILFKLKIKLKNYSIGFEFLMHGSYNLATFNATTYAQLISKKESQTQDWHQDFATDATNGWEDYYEKSEN
jgi:uncharacterized membrane protein